MRYIKWRWQGVGGQTRGDGEGRVGGWRVLV